MSSKRGAVRLVLDDGKTVGAAARDLDLTETALREWVRRAQADRTQGPDRADDGGARGARAAAQRESRAADGARHPKKSRGLLREAPSVRFAWIAAERADFTVAECCRALRVSPSGFYAWQRCGRRRRGPRAIGSCGCRSARPMTASRGRYGRPRSGRTCTRQGERVSQKRVARLMREEGLRARARKRFRSTTMSEHDQPDCRQCAGPPVRRRAAQSALGRRYDRVPHRQQRQALSGGHSRSLLPVHRGLGAERGQRSPPDAPCTRHGA